MRSTPSHLSQPNQTSQPSQASQANQAIYERVVTLCACGNLRIAARIITQRYDAFLQPSGLLITQFKLLGTLATQSAIALSPLAEGLALDPTTLTHDAPVSLPAHPFPPLRPSQAGAWNYAQEGVLGHHLALHGCHFCYSSLALSSCG